MLLCSVNDSQALQEKVILSLAISEITQHRLAPLCGKLKKNLTTSEFMECISFEEKESTLAVGGKRDIWVYQVILNLG